MELGVKVIGFTILMVLMLLFSGKYVARIMKEKEELGMLLGSGGVASIAGASEVLEQSEEDFAMAIIGMNILGLTAMTVIPIVSKFLNLNMTQSALYIGGTLSSFIHIIPAGYSIGEESLGLALLIKTGKLLFFPLVLIYMAKTKNRKGEVTSKSSKLPIFIKGFMVVGLVFTLLEYIGTKVNNEVYLNSVELLKNIFNYTFRYLLMFALIGIGGKINIRALLSKGKGLIFFSLVLMVVQVVLGAVIVKLFY
jgi:uncharacterized membrane protein YadS